MISTRHHVLDRKFKLDYREGTRCTTVSFDNEPGVDWEFMLGYAVGEFMVRYRDEIREQLDPHFDEDDVFVTIGRTTSEILVEISDRLVLDRWDEEPDDDGWGGPYQPNRPDTRKEANEW